MLGLKLIHVSKGGNSLWTTLQCSLTYNMRALQATLPQKNGFSVLTMCQASHLLSTKSMTINFGYAHLTR